MIISSRGYVNHEGREIKFLTATQFTYQDGFCREFYYRLPDGDPRTADHWWGASQACADWLSQLPVSQWCEVVCPNAQQTNNRELTEYLDKQGGEE